MAENPDDIFEESLSPTDIYFLEGSLKEGKLDRRITQIREFFKRHRDELDQKIPNPDDDAVVFDQLIALIINKGTVDHASEMMDQAHEIQKHFWIEGEKGNHHQHSLFFDWVIHHAPNWRRWRIKEYKFVALKNGVEMYRDLLRESES